LTAQAIQEEIKFRESRLKTLNAFLLFDSTEKAKKLEIKKEIEQIEQSFKEEYKI
jgi:hypothetical protein